VAPLPSPARGWRGRAIVAVAALACVLAATAAARGGQVGNSAPPDGPPQQRAVLDLVVNEAKAGQVLAVIRRADILVPPEALRRAGVREVEGRTEIVGTRSFVSLASLAPGVRYRLDEKALVLQLTARPEQLGTHRLDFRNQQRAFTFSRTTSAFLNYGLDWRQSSSRSATAELGLNLRGVLLTTSGTWQPGRRFVPGLTSVVLDDRARLRRIVVGESFAGDRLLGGNILLAGVKVARDYSVDPYFVQYPLLGMSGLVETPSTVEVYVDGRLVRQERLQPGRFELANIPVPVGSSRTQVVVRDVFGREQELRAPYYLANKVLAAGLHEYEYGVGLPRVNASDYSVAYEEPVLLARHRYGFTNWFTAGMRLEAREHLVSGGPSVNLRMPIGEFELAGALSGGRNGTGGAMALGYAFTGSPFSIGLSGRAATERYRTIASRLVGDESRFEVSGYAGVRIGRGGSLSIQHAQGETFERVARSRTSLFGSLRAGRRAHLAVSVGRTESNGVAAADASVGLTFALGARNVATVSAGVMDGNPMTSLELMRSLPVGEGCGYRLRTGAAGDPFASGRFEYQSPYGRHEITEESRNGLNAAGVSIAGGVVAIGGSLFATRPVRDGYGLLRVPGVKGVRGYVSNQQVGRTNGRGDLLMPNLLPYYANRVSIADQDVPVGHEVPVREQAVGPSYRGGAVVTFKADKISAVTGTVRVASDAGEAVPEYGDLVVQKRNEGIDLSPVGRGGRFYFERLAPGRYTATVRYHGASCDFTLVVPPSQAPVVNAGTYSCRLEAKVP